MKKSVFSSPWLNNCGSNYGAYECSLCITGDQCKCVFLSPLADIREYGEVWKAMVTEEGLCWEYFCVLAKPYSLRLHFRHSGPFCSPLRCDLWHHIHVVYMRWLCLTPATWCGWFFCCMFGKTAVQQEKAQHENKCQPKSKRGHLCVNCREKVTERKNKYFQAFV